MDSTTILLIRACKAGSYNAYRTPHTRLQSVYRRFYAGETPVSDRVLTQILLPIVENYGLISLSVLLNYIDPENPVYASDDFDARVLNAMLNAIRFAPIERLEGYIRPRRFR